MHTVRHVPVWMINHLGNTCYTLHYNFTVLVMNTFICYTSDGMNQILSIHLHLTGARIKDVLLSMKVALDG